MHWVVDLGQGCYSMQSEIGDFRFSTYQKIFHFEKFLNTWWKTESKEGYFVAMETCREDSESCLGIHEKY